MVHVLKREDAIAAIRAGADSLAHLFADKAGGQEFAKLAQLHGILVTPTLQALEAACGKLPGKALTEDPKIIPYLTEAMRGALLQRMPPVPDMPKTCDKAPQTLRELRKYGVSLAVGGNGFDYGVYPGVSVHREMELMVKAGIPAIEVLQAATSSPLEWFNLKDRGRIEPGLRADLVLVNGDPSENIKATRDIVLVLKDGLEVDRAALANKVLQEKARAEIARKEPAPAGSESGLVADFEDGTAKTRFGFGLVPANDARPWNGKSTAEIKVVDGGAHGSKYSLLVSGEVREGSSMALAGVTFFPGVKPMAPVNLSGKKKITFWIKGDPQRRYRVHLMSLTHNTREPIEVTREWKKVEMPYTIFEKFEAHDLVSAMIVTGAEPGPVQFQIDDFRFE